MTEAGVHILPLGQILINYTHTHTQKVRVVACECPIRGPGGRPRRDWPSAGEGVQRVLCQASEGTGKESSPV